MAGELTLTLNERDYAFVQRQLSKLTVLEQDAVVRKGLSEGVGIIKKQGKTNYKNTLSTDPHNVKMRQYMAKKRGGSLLNSFGTKVNKKQGKGYAGFSKYGHHAHLVDSGTVNRFAYTLNNAPRGRVQGSKFWRSAFEAKKNEAAQTLMDSITISINRILNRNR